MQTLAIFNAPKVDEYSWEVTFVKSHPTGELWKVTLMPDKEGHILSESVWVSPTDWEKRIKTAMHHLVEKRKFIFTSEKVKAGVKIVSKGF